MRIENVKILNFRQYKNVEFDFSNRGKSDIHLIIGNNGIGKTNLLNAISWCLYNKEPHLGNSKIARKRINSEALEEAINEGKDKCKVEVSIEFSVDDKTILCTRVQEFKANREAFEYKPQLTITVTSINGCEVLVDEELMQKQIQQYLPEEISEYFFFDGEQLDKYFIDGQGERVYDAIYNISQVSLLSSMRDRLKVVIADYQNEAGRKNVGVSDLFDEKTSLVRQLEELNKNIEEISNQNRIAEDKILEYNILLKGKEGIPDKEKEYEEISGQMMEKREEFYEIKNELQSFLVEYKILLSLYPCFIKALDLINKKEVRGELPPNVDINFLEKMLSSHKCLVCNRDISEKEEEYIGSLLKKLNVSSSVSHKLVQMKGYLEDAIERCKEYPKYKEKLLKKIKKNEQEFKILEDRFNKLDSELKNYSDKEKIKDIYIQREDYKERKNRNQEKIVNLSVSKNQLAEKLDQVERDLKKAIENKEDLEYINKEIAFAQKAKNIVETIEDELMEEARIKMVDETKEMFDRLDWKTQTFDRIELDKSYNLELYDKYGYSMLGSCSAAERALLALSFTLALQKVSGYNSMLFIDTPVGRVDLENRENFAEVLNMIGQNKQVIMTFTPSEYSEEIRSLLEPNASSYKKLVTRDEVETYIVE